MERYLIGHVREISPADSEDANPPNPDVDAERRVETRRASKREGRKERVRETEKKRESGNFD